MVVIGDCFFGVIGKNQGGRGGGPPWSAPDIFLVKWPRPPAKSALQKMARGGEGGSARRENKPYITGAEAKVYATLKSDTIMVIVVYTDSHAD